MFILKIKLLTKFIWNLLYLWRVFCHKSQISTHPRISGGKHIEHRGVAYVLLLKSPWHFFMFILDRHWQNLAGKKLFGLAARSFGIDYGVCNSQPVYIQPFHVLPAVSENDPKWSYSVPAKSSLDEILNFIQNTFPCPRLLCYARRIFVDLLKI